MYLSCKYISSPYLYFHKSISYIWTELYILVTTYFLLNLQSHHPSWSWFKSTSYLSPCIYVWLALSLLSRLPLMKLDPAVLCPVLLCTLLALYIITYMMKHHIHHIHGQYKDVGTLFIICSYRNDVLMIVWSQSVGEWWWNDLSVISPDQG